jgi:hypothetical protein
MRKIPGDALPKGMKIPEPEPQEQEKKYITLAEANYVADIRKAISELPYNIEIQELVVTEGRNSPPVIQLVMTIT